MIDGLLVAAAVILVFISGFYCGDKHVQSLWDTQKIIDNSALVAAQTKVIKQERAGNQINQEVSEYYAKLISNPSPTHDIVVSSLQQQAGAAHSMPKATTSASRTDGASKLSDSCKKAKAKAKGLQLWAKEVVANYNR